ncbi:hypothetical protein IQ254_24280 [Nodosilinea sp. LEGE 07088]|uniref:hypothetical protein n=1 Tax=Nodosilinea sp. LEGE 07088 TaxID=2777968 RepID=UPI00187F6BA5|nr:hypothetical protein [Nodosilinea sp. LEGE 07088]MBE9140279.1 hypothetical protein [Nodosilinea sp. LEGE 07088]
MPLGGHGLIIPKSMVYLDMNPYTALGLRGNPFVATDPTNPVTDPWIDRGWSAASPLQSRQLVQFIGVPGSGKTAHLKHWQAQTGGPYCLHPTGWKRFKLPAVHRITYWDEANRIPFILLVVAFAWATLTRATIVAATHTELSQTARLLGLRVNTIQLPPLAPEMLMDWASGRIQAVRLPDRDCTLTLPQAQAAAIVLLANGSWREAANQLHIWAADCARQSALNALPNQKHLPSIASRTATGVGNPSQLQQPISLLLLGRVPA